MVALGSLPSQPASGTDRHRFVRQGLWHANRIALLRRGAAGWPASVRREQVVRGFVRAQLCRDLQPAGRHHAVRQLFWRRRFELEPDRARHGAGGLARHAADHSLRRAVRSRLFLCRGRSRGLHVVGGKTGRRRTAARRGLQLLERAAVDGARPGQRTFADFRRRSSTTRLGRCAHEIRHQYLSAAKARTLLGWRPLFSLQQGLQRTIDWYKDFLEQTPSWPTHTFAADLVAKSA